MRKGSFRVVRLAAAAAGVAAIVACSDGNGGGVGPIPPANATVTWDFCTTDALPLWFAAQDGTGAWTRITPTGAKFTFDIASGKGGVAFVTSAAGATQGSAASTARPAVAQVPGLAEVEALLRDRAVGSRIAPASADLRQRAMQPFATPAAAARSAIDEFGLTVMYGSDAELNEFGAPRCESGVGKTVNGSVANLATGDLADATLGQSYTPVHGNMPTFRFTNVGAGPLDLIVSRTTLDPTTAMPVVDRMILRRGLDPADNSTLPALDFNGADAFPTAVRNIEVENAGEDVLFAFSLYTTVGAASAFVGLDGPKTIADPINYYGVPAANQAGGDLHFAGITATGTSALRSVGMYFKEATDRTLALGALLPAPAVEAIATTPYVRFRAAGSLPSDYNRRVTASFVQGGRREEITVSAGYVSNGRYELTIPDFAGVPGWVDDWGLKQGTETLWSIGAIGFTGTGVTRVVPAEGVTIRQVFESGTATP